MYLVSVYEAQYQNYSIGTFNLYEWLEDVFH